MQTCPLLSGVMRMRLFNKGFPLQLNSGSGCETIGRQNHQRILPCSSGRENSIPLTLCTLFSICQMETILLYAVVMRGYNVHACNLAHGSGSIKWQFFVFVFFVILKITLLANCLQPKDPEIYHNHVGTWGRSGQSAAPPTRLVQPCETMLTYLCLEFWPGECVK